MNKQTSSLNQTLARVALVEVGLLQYETLYHNCLVVNMSNVSIAEVDLLQDETLTKLT